MAITALATIEDVELEGTGPFVRVAVGAPELCPSFAAGQFVLADLGGFVRDALFPARIEAGLFKVLVAPDHPAARLGPGTHLSLIGPLGRGYHVPASTRRLLLVADTPNLPAVLPLVSEGPTTTWEIALLMISLADGSHYPMRRLPPAVEVQLWPGQPRSADPDDRDRILDELIRWADHVCLAADPHLYRQVARVVRRQRLAPASSFAEALVTPPMACGVGACQGCAIATTRGIRLACTDGPVFDLLELCGQ